MTSLIDHLVTRYGVGPAYARAYIDYWNGAGHSGLRDRADLDRLLPHEAMWFDYALSTNWRGDGLADAVGARPGGTGARYLDIGCGFGGAMIAFGRRGFEVVGIELDPVRVSLAKANLAELPPARGARVVSGDVLDSRFVEDLGTFDVITCIDVIEHVASVEQTLQRAWSILRPGGTLVFEIPNKDAVRFVQSDGHFTLFGITQLPRWAAIEYQQANHGFDYDVGDYYPLAYYLGRLRALGAQVHGACSPLQQPMDWETFQHEARAFLAMDLDTHVRGLEGCPPAVRPLLLRCAQAYRDELTIALAGASSDPASRTQTITRFGCPFWMVTARKSTDA